MALPLGNPELLASLAPDEGSDSRLSTWVIRKERRSPPDRMKQWVQTQTIDEPWHPLSSDVDLAKRQEFMRRIDQHITRTQRLDVSLATDNGSSSRGAVGNQLLVGTGCFADLSSPSWSPGFTGVGDSRDPQPKYSQRPTQDNIVPIVPVLPTAAGSRAQPLLEDMNHNEIARLPPTDSTHDRSFTAAKLQNFEMSRSHLAEIEKVARGLVCSWQEARRGWKLSARDQCVASLQHGDGAAESSGQGRELTRNEGIRCTQCTKKVRGANGKWRAEHDDEDDEKDSPNGEGKKRQVLSDHVGEILACPFWKYDPMKYALQSGCKCSTHLLNSIARLKQHLYRAHCPPDYYCRRCFDAFTTDELLLAHNALKIPCQPTSSPYTDKITSIQLVSIKKKTPKKTETECWYHIYAILFPGDVPPESPFLDDRSPVQAVVSDLVHYVRVHAAVRLSNRIAAGFVELQPILSQLSHDVSGEGALADIRSVAVAIFCDELARRAFRIADTQSQPEPSDSHRSTPELTNGTTETTLATSSFDFGAPCFQAAGTIAFPATSLQLATNQLSNSDWQPGELDGLPALHEPDELTLLPDSYFRAFLDLPSSPPHSGSGDELFPQTRQLGEQAPVGRKPWPGTQGF